MAKKFILKKLYLWALYSTIQRRYNIIGKQYRAKFWIKSWSDRRRSSLTTSWRILSLKMILFKKLMKKSKRRRLSWLRRMAKIMGIPCKNCMSKRISFFEDYAKFKDEKMEISKEIHEDHIIEKILKLRLWRQLRKITSKSI